jgi:D-sedoheptulose 7-phosphate isomerase
MTNLAADTFAETEANFRKLREQADEVTKAGELCVKSLKNGGHIFLCGNGGSASDAQHIAAELVGRFLKERRPLPSTALHCNTATITAVANDYSYDVIYSRQLEGLGKKGDVLIGLTTSGNSKNVVKAAESAKAMGITVIGMTGEKGGAMEPLSDLCLKVPAKATARVQEMHIAIGHVICAMIDDAF